MENQDYAVVTVEGLYLVKIKEIFKTKDDAEAAKKKYPHPYGTHVYPVNGPLVKVGGQWRRNKEHEKSNN